MKSIILMLDKSTVLKRSQMIQGSFWFVWKLSKLNRCASFPMASSYDPNTQLLSKTLLYTQFSLTFTGISEWKLATSPDRPSWTGSWIPQDRFQNISRHIYQKLNTPKNPPHTHSSKLVLKGRLTSLFQPQTTYVRHL